MPVPAFGAIPKRAGRLWGSSARAEMRYGAKRRQAVASWASRRQTAQAYGATPKLVELWAGRCRTTETPFGEKQKRDAVWWASPREKALECGGPASRAMECMVKRTLDHGP